MSEAALAYTITGRLRGHLIGWRPDAKEWVYADTGEPTIGNPRWCGKCGQRDTTEGHDSCIANLPGVQNACCGHGVPGEAYVHFENGMVIRGNFDHVETE